MKFKLDENIGRRGLGLLSAAGHDVSTVVEQGLSGSPDQTVFEVCCRESRVLITLDRDFGQVLRFPPERSAGLVILELGPCASPQAIDERLRQFLPVLETHTLAGCLWIVEPGRVRIHLRSGEE